LTESEVATRDGQVLLGCRGDLQVDAGAGASLVVLAGRVQEARAPPEGRRSLHAGGQRVDRLGEGGIGLAVEVGHDGDVPVLTVELRDEGPEGAPDRVRPVEPLATEVPDLDRTVHGVDLGTGGRG